MVSLAPLVALTSGSSGGEGKRPESEHFSQHLPTFRLWQHRASQNKEFSSSPSLFGLGVIWERSFLRVKAIAHVRQSVALIFFYTVFLGVRHRVSPGVSTQGCIRSLVLHCSWQGSFTAR